MYQEDNCYGQLYAILNCRIVEYNQVYLRTICQLLASRLIDLRTKKIVLMHNFTSFSWKVSLCTILLNLTLVQKENSRPFIKSFMQTSMWTEFFMNNLIYITMRT